MYAASRVSKRYGGVVALEEAELEIRGGEVHALLGANGAGKSTLVKILAGAERPSSGTLTLDGEPVRFSHVRDAAEHGVAIVSQELNLFPDLSVLANLFLGRESLTAGVIIDRREMRRRAALVVDSVGLGVDLDVPLHSLRLGERQLVEIGRALLEDPKILILDEPTSALDEAETQRLHAVVGRMRESGVAIVYVSHILDDVFAIADTVSILRNGRSVMRRRPREELTIRETVGQMLGDVATRPERPARPMEARCTASLRLEAVEVSGRLHALTLEAMPGEVVGLAGLEGAGPETVFDLVFGRRRADRGRVMLPDGSGQPRTVARAVRAGIAYVPADRKRLGLMLEKSVEANISLVSGGPLRRLGFLLRRRVTRARAGHWARQLDIKLASTATPAGQLSGGNQQKVVFAKWLETDPDVLLLDDPTRGVDVGAKLEMQDIIGREARRGRVVLYRSNDLEEMATICHRAIVFFGGAVCGELHGDAMSEHRLLEAINTGELSVSTL